jgi:hypothetical protein
MAKDWGIVRDSVEGALKSELAGMIDSSINDLNGPIRKASDMLTVAIRRGPAGAELVEEIKDTLAIAMLDQKVKAKKHVTGVMDVVIGTGLNMLFQGAVLGMQDLKPKGS